ncbi:hypothetical protein AC579_1132 [Pseudocercospora musae]|uniref:Uncharacterized protein n=1 Tax=Pseudocercospora musae TaxID=113226 RepID=A0A139I8C4_9PEZI|nr:hypothetical protein AC579_1700 [Pseudocercospora musae]KXT10977.1 hypothetical protein AC579_1132 [Pseudocercospora musae]
MFDSTRASNYTVGLPGWQASRMLFGEEDEDEPAFPNARYQYVYGKINGHHVVMGCLPDSQMGANFSLTSIWAPRRSMRSLG